MQTIKENILYNTLAFIKAFNFETTHDVIMGKKVDIIRVLYKLDYFKENSPNYKKGIGDIIIIFDSDYRVVIKQIISGTWCFALLNAPYTVSEEHWHLSPEQEKILPDLIIALEAGFPYRNNFGNLNFEFNDK